MLSVGIAGERLAIAGDLDPVIVDGDRFIDGGHRVKAYALAPTAVIEAMRGRRWTGA